jgi:hypothetical protein
VLVFQTYTYSIASGQTHELPWQRTPTCLTTDSCSTHTAIDIATPCKGTALLHRRAEQTLPRGLLSAMSARGTARGSASTRRKEKTLHSLGPSPSCSSRDQFHQPTLSGHTYLYLFEPLFVVPTCRNGCDGNDDSDDDKRRRRPLHSTPHHRSRTQALANCCQTRSSCGEEG